MLRWARVVLATATVAACSGDERDPRDPVGPRDTTGLWAVVVVESHGAFGASLAAWSMARDGGPLASCGVTEGCLVQSSTGPSPCSFATDRVALGRLTATTSSFGPQSFFADFPAANSPAVVDGDTVLFAHLGSADVRPFELSVAVPSLADVNLGGCVVRETGVCSVEPSRPLFIETKTPGDVALSLVIDGAPLSPRVECVWADGQASVRVPPAVAAQLRRGASLRAHVSATRIQRQPLEGRLVEARGARTLGFTLDLRP